MIAEQSLSQNCLHKMIELKNLVIEENISPGRTLFFLDLGADLVKEGEGDLSRIWL